ncbi:HNH endonuclease [Acetobacter malorum]|uniref:HNH endonuclease n=1 Tax=Acetobacter malorum TaxID=178901 RepID=UPI0039EB5049
MSGNLMLSREKIQDRLREKGYDLAHDSWAYADEYKVGTRYIYIARIKRNHTFLVVDRPTYEVLFQRKINGVLLDKEIKNADFRKFEEKNATGSYVGFYVNFETLLAFDKFLDVVSEQEAYEDTVSLDIEDINNSPRLTPTQKQALIKARIGQGIFREGLIERWGGRCAVTGVSILEVLRASHIKPWAIASDNERLDPNNGLLLIATLDAAFDKHLISFSDDGEMLLSERLGTGGYALLGVSPDARLHKALNSQQKAHLREHRMKLR